MGESEFLIKIDFYEGSQWLDTKNVTFVIPPIVGDKIRVGMGTFKVNERFVSQGRNPIIHAEIHVVRVSE